MTDPKIRINIHRQILFAKGRTTAKEISAAIGHSLNSVVQEVIFLGKAGYLRAEKGSFVDFKANDCFWVKDWDRLVKYATGFHYNNKLERASALIKEACYLIGQDEVKKLLDGMAKG